MAAGTKVDICIGRVGGAVWTARYFTYSWVAFGVSFVTLKRNLLHFVRQELQVRGGMMQAHPQILDVVETARSEQSLGHDERTVDNSQSDTTVTRSIKATKRWRQSCTLEIEKSRVSGHSLDLKLIDVVALKGSMEETLRRQYASSTEEEQTFEEVTLVVLGLLLRTGNLFVSDQPRNGQHLAVGRPGVNIRIRRGVEDRSISKESSGGARSMRASHGRAASPSATPTTPSGSLRSIPTWYWTRAGGGSTKTSTGFSSVRPYGSAPRNLRLSPATAPADSRSTGSAA